MKVYVAGAWVEADYRAKPVMNALRAKGIEITVDWTSDVPGEHIATESGDRVHERDLPEEERRARAVEDYNGIMGADVFLFLVPDERGASGAWTEFGLALGRNIPIILAGKNSRRTIFTAMAGCQHFPNDLAAINEVLSMTVKSS